MTDDPYVCPGANVLRNVPGLRHADALEKFEQAAVAVRIRQGAPTGNFDLAHLRAIHCHLFQDVFEWAGEVRSVQIAKGDCAFMPPGFIQTGMADVEARLRDRNFLKNLDRPAFVREAAAIIGDVNHVHPFREGNGRTQMQYLKQLCEQAGHPLDLRRIDPKIWIDASIAANRADYSVMEKALNKAYVAAERIHEVRELRKQAVGFGR